MASDNVEDARFQEILELEGIDLGEFYQQVPNEDLFPPAQRYPQFFNDNLVSPNRIIKEFLNNPQSNIRIFYFQLLRLGYEIESETNNNRNFIVNLRRIIFHPDFEILFTQETEDQRNLFNDFQFKRLFAEFIVLLDRQEFPNVQQIISHYPILDTIFIHIFRSLLANQNINEEFDAMIPSEVVFGQLSNLLALTLTSYGNCWKFQDSDMFCFEQGDTQLYLAYIVDDGQASQSQEPVQQQQYPPQVQVQQPVYQNNNIHPDAVHTDSNIIAPANVYSNTYQNSYDRTIEQTNQNTYQTYQVNPTVPAQIPYSNTNQGYANNAQINIQPNFSYNSISQNRSIEVQGGFGGLQQKDSGALSFNANDYFSNEVNRSDNRAPFSSSYQPQEYRQQYKPYQSSYTNTYSNNNNTSSNTYNTSSNSNNYNTSYGVSSNNYNSYDYKTKPVEIIPAVVYQPNNYTPTFKPVEPTPIPTFDNYKPSYQPKRQYSKPSTSYETYNDYKPTQPSSAYTSSVFESKTYSNNAYKSTYVATEGGEYYKDFTPPDILAKLRSDNRDNINRIKDSMKGLTRGGQLPPGFDLKKSAVFGGSNESTFKQDLYRNQSRSQFEYQEINKSSLATQYKPYGAEISQYPNKPYSSYSYQGGYTSYNTSY